MQETRKYDIGSSSGYKVESRARRDGIGTSSASTYGYKVENRAIN